MSGERGSLRADDDPALLNLVALDASADPHVITTPARTGTHRSGQLAYRLYFDTDRRVITVPRQVVTCPHYFLPTLDSRAEITIPTTA